MVDSTHCSKNFIGRESNFDDNSFIIENPMPLKTIQQINFDNFRLEKSSQLRKKLQMSPTNGHQAASKSIHFILFRNVFSQSNGE